MNSSSSSAVNIFWWSRSSRWIFWMNFLRMVSSNSKCTNVSSSVAMVFYNGIRKVITRRFLLVWLPDTGRRSRSSYYCTSVNKQEEFDMLFQQCHVSSEWITSMDWYVYGCEPKEETLRLNHETSFFTEKYFHRTDFSEVKCVQTV